ncbi:MAG: efflux RND transporter periplasmic adaptor subunit [Candidatus Eremiobacteraeota bacterium]|nr:efflux RND transporter periplasmic adaptor subunit [Candidatus Eremiobacteraeota bacterium]MBV8720653.1 efflux RND transporter periplasmic adaptor subunit [Candidatus Eremiobacteraeota bacterium]
MKPRVRNLIIIAIALVAIVGITVVVRRNGGSVVPVPMQKIARTTFVIKLPENGVVMKPRTATVPTLVAGNVGTILVRAGDRVSAGELLATIDNPTLEYTAAGSRADSTSASANITAARVQEENAKVGYDATVQSNLASLNDARRVYRQDVELYANKAIPRNQLDTDKTHLEQAQVAYDQAVEQSRLGAVSGYNGNSVQYAQAEARKAQIIDAQNQQQLAFMHVVAPFEGVIQTVATQPNDPLRPLQSGDPVTEGQALFTIAGGSGYIVRAEVDEQDVINVRIGQRANVTGQDFPGKTIAGHVSDVAPVATKSTDPSSTAKQVLTTISLDASPAFLRDGMSADVDILTSYVPDAIVVPNDAVVRDKGKTFVYVVAGGTAREQPVRLGKASDTQTQILSGLRPGDVIVAGKVPELTPGARVTPKPSPSPSSSP